MVRSLITILAILMFQHSHADVCYEDKTPQYVIASTLKVRVEPRSDARIVGLLPIGTPIFVLPERIQNSDGTVACGPLVEGPWLSICTELDAIDPICANGAHGWVNRDMIDRIRPRLEVLLANYDRTPRNDLQERRKWAERAAELDPTDSRAKQRLLSVLEETADKETTKVWKDKFARYSNPQPSLEDGEKKAAYIYKDSGLFRYCTLDSKAVCSRPSVYEPEQDQFMDRGKFYYLYSEGRHVGWLVTEQRNCKGARCIARVPVRFLPNTKGEAPQGGLATNYMLPKSRTTSSQPTSYEKSEFLKLADRWINSGNRITVPDCPSLPEEIKNSDGPAGYESRVCENERGAKLSFVKEVKNGEYLQSMIAARSSAGTMLVGVWVIGTESGAKYSEEGFLSLLLIAEQDKSGAHRITFSDPAVGECGIFDHADLNIDGTDEIFLACNHLEGTTSTGYLRLVDGKWIRN